MSFTDANWSCISSSLSQGQELVNGVILNSPNIFTYSSPTDSTTTIFTADYFLSKHFSLSVGDIILGSGTNATFGAIITVVSSTTVTVADFFPSSGGGSVTPAQVQESAFNIGIDTGVSDAYVVDLTPAPASLTDGLVVIFTATNGNSGNSTLNVNGFGDLALVSTFGFGQLLANQIVGFSTYAAIYNAFSGYWVLQNPTTTLVDSTTVADQATVQHNGYNFCPDTGVADAYTGTLSPNNGDPSLGTFILFWAANNNATTTPTLSINAESPVNITKPGGPLVPDDIVAGTVALFLRTNFSIYQLLNPQQGF